MLRVGLTGGMGSGKSSVSALFAEFGVPVLDADRIVRELTQPGLSASREIHEAFGAEVFATNQDIDRRRLAQRVFANPAERHILEQILHPRVRAEITKRLGQMTAPYCILEIPLLIESGQRDLVDRVLVVAANEALRMQRVQARDGRSEREIRAILSTQASDVERQAAAQDFILNEGDVPALRARVQELHKSYIQLALGELA